MQKFILSFFLSTLFLNASEFKLVTEHFPPYQIDEKTKLSGISVDIINEIQKRLHTKYPIDILSWSDAYTKTLKNKNHIIFSIGRIQSREKNFKWVGPITKLKYVFFKNANNKINIRNFDDAKKVDAILVTKNDVSHQILQKLNFKNLVVSNSQNNNENILKLANSNKNILWASDHASGLYKIKQLGLKSKIKATMTNRPVSATTMNIAFNKSANQDIVKKWQNTLNNIKDDGTYEIILNKYK